MIERLRDAILGSMISVQRLIASAMLTWLAILFLVQAVLALQDGIRKSDTADLYYKCRAETETVTDAVLLMIVLIIVPGRFL